MERLSYTAAREEFETLLGRFLWNDLDRYGKRRLLRLVAAHPDFQFEFQDLCALDEELQALQSVELNASAESVEPIDSVPLAANRARPRWPGLVAAAGLALLLGLGALWVMAPGGGLQNLLVPGFGRPAVAASLHGACGPAAESTAPPADQATPLHNASADRFCTLRLEDGAALVQLLPGASGELRFAGDRVQVRLNGGGLLALGRTPDADARLRIFAGAQRIRLIGTQVFVQRTAAGVQVDVLEGEAAADANPAYLASETRRFSAERALARADDGDASGEDAERAVRISQNQSVFWPADEAQQALAERALGRLPELDPAADPVQRDRALAAWRATLTPAEREALHLGEGASSGAPPQPHPLPESRKTILEELVGLADRETPDPEASSGDADATDQRNAPIAPQLRPKQLQQLEELETTAGPPGPHRIRLRDGRTLRGRAVQDGDRLRIERRGEADLVVPLDAVRSIEIP